MSLSAMAEDIQRTLEDARKEAQREGYAVHEGDPEDWIQLFQEEIGYDLKSYKPDGTPEEAVAFRKMATAIQQALDEAVFPSDHYDAEYAIEAAGKVLVTIAEKCPEAGKEIAGYLEPYARHADPFVKKTMGSTATAVRKVLQKAEAAENAVHGGPLDGKTVAFTGTLSVPRDDAAALAIQNGATVVGSVSKNTDFLVVGEKTVGSKLDKARGLGVEVVSEEAFHALCAGASAQKDAPAQGQSNNWQDRVAASKGGQSQGRGR